MALLAGGGFEAVNGRRLGEFAPDSPLEGTGFEPSVPRKAPSILAAAALVRAVTANRGDSNAPRMALCQRAGEGSVAALSTARSIFSTVMSGVMLTRTTPVELPTSDTAVADAASG